MEGQPSPFQYEKRDGYDEAQFSDLLAEQLPADYVYNRFRKLSTQRSAYGRYRSAFAHIEFALCQSASLDSEARAAFLYDCNFILTRPMGLDDHHTTDSLRLSASILCSYLQVFKKRALGQDITQDDCALLYKSLGSALTMSMAFAHNTEAINSRLAEGLMYALSVRTGQSEHLIWPASPREEASDDQPSNHDGYTIINNNHKMRVQTKLVKTDKHYREPTIVVVIEELLTHISRKAAKRLQQPITEVGIEEMIDIIFRESSGMGISPREKYQLDLATARLVKPLAGLQKAA